KVSFRLGPLPPVGVNMPSPFQEIPIVPAKLQGFRVGEGSLVPLAAFGKALAHFRPHFGAAGALLQQAGKFCICLAPLAPLRMIAKARQPDTEIVRLQSNRMLVLRGRLRPPALVGVDPESVDAKLAIVWPQFDRLGIFARR